MQITKENIGDTLCLYQTAKHIRILDVNPQYVDYATEDGYHYATYEHFANAIVVSEPSRLAIFDENYRLGKTLNAAEYKAFTGMLNGSEKVKSDVSSVLSVIKEQQKHLDSRLASERKRTVPGETLASRFLSQLSELPSGSHDTFWGHKVQLVSNWSYEFQIDGQTMDYSAAKDYLSKVYYAEPTKKRSLSDTINAANIRRESVSSSGFENSLSVPER